MKSYNFATLQNLELSFSNHHSNSNLYFFQIVDLYISASRPYVIPSQLNYTPYSLKKKHVEGS